MENFIPYKKLSKKEKRKIDQAKRQTWGELNPVTRKPVNSKAYNRKKSQAWKRDGSPTACIFFAIKTKKPRLFSRDYFAFFHHHETVVSAFRPPHTQFHE